MEIGAVLAPHRAGIADTEFAQQGRCLGCPVPRGRAKTAWHNAKARSEHLARALHHLQLPLGRQVAEEFVMMPVIGNLVTGAQDGRAAFGPLLDNPGRDEEGRGHFMTGKQVKQPGQGAKRAIGPLGEIARVVAQRAVKHGIPCRPVQIKGQTDSGPVSVWP